MTRTKRWYGELVLDKLVLDGQAPLLIAPFGNDDLDSIYAIECRSHKFPWKLSHFRDSVKTSHHHCIGVSHQGCWLAYAVVSCIAGEAELLLLVVDKQWQGRGIAKHFLDHLIGCLTGFADTIFLEVRAGNEPAIALYEAAQFNQLGTRPGYYRAAGSVEDAFIYARAIE